MTLLVALPDQIAGPVAGLVTSLVTSLVVLLAGGAPEPEDVKAGWTAFAIFLLLAVAVAFLGRSLFKQLRKAQAAQEAGVYDRDQRPADETAPGPENGEPHRS
jgi:hypothetical protein